MIGCLSVNRSGSFEVTAVTCLQRYGASWTSVLAFLCGFLWPVDVSARTIHVKKTGGGDAVTIQGGILLTQTGDSVLVGPGTYNENVDFMGRNIVVVSEAGAASTVIDGSGHLNSVVRFAGGEGAGTRLSGFTVTGGSGYEAGQSATPRGGGIYVNNAEPIIEYCRVTRNSVGGRGYAGGIFASATSTAGFAPRIVNCEIVGNTAGGNGGGVLAAGYARVTVEACAIYNNVVLDGDGGGLYAVMDPQGTVAVINCEIHHNEVYDHGGGIYFGSIGFGPRSFEIRGNLVWNNVARAVPATGETGGGLWLKDCRGVVTGNTIVGNRGEGGGNAQGGGIAAYNCPQMEITNNIIAWNPAGGGLFGRGTPPVTVRDNIFWMNQVADVTGTCSGIDLTTTNLHVDPQLCDVGAGNLGVANGSPALTHPGGVVGALSAPGCAAVPVVRTTWGMLKAGKR